MNPLFIISSIRIALDKKIVIDSKHRFSKLRVKFVRHIFQLWAMFLLKPNGVI